MSLTIKEVMPENYGYVVLVVAGGSLVNFWHFKQLHAARTQYDVKVSVMLCGLAKAILSGSKFDF